MYCVADGESLQCDEMGSLHTDTASRLSTQWRRGHWHQDPDVQQERQLPSHCWLSRWRPTAAALLPYVSLHSTLVGTPAGYATSIQQPTPAAAAVQALAVSPVGLSPSGGAATRCSERPGSRMMLHMQLRGMGAVQTQLLGRGPIQTQLWGRGAVQMP